jgi:DNA-binding NtrC family response regulator
MSEHAILVIDDDPDLRALVRFLLEPMGVDVIEGASCVEGIALLATNRDRIRLVLLDYLMPHMDPKACVRKLQSLVGLTMIVLCTAAVHARETADELGLAHCLPKPFALEALEGLVREALEQAQLPPGQGADLAPT